MNDNPIIGKMMDNTIAAVDGSLEEDGFIPSATWLSIVVWVEMDWDDWHEYMDSMHMFSHNDASINDEYCVPLPTAQNYIWWNVQIRNQ